MPSDSKGLRKAVAAKVIEWLRENGSNDVIVRDGWSMVADLLNEALYPGKRYVLVTQGPSGIEFGTRGEASREVGLQVSTIVKLPNEAGSIESILDSVVELRERLEEWMLEDRDNGAVAPFGDYSFSGMLRAQSTEQPIVEKYLIENNAAISYFIPSWTTG